MITATTVDLEVNSSSFQQQNITFQPLNVFSSDKVSTKTKNGASQFKKSEKSLEMKSEELLDSQLFEVEDEIKPTFITEVEQVPVGFNEDTFIYKSDVIPVTENLLPGIKYISSFCFLI